MKAKPAIEGGGRQACPSLGGSPPKTWADIFPGVAERISLGIITVRQLIHAGKLGCARVGRALVIPKA